MQVLAFTSGGDGVKSAPVSCHTEQDGLWFSLKCFNHGSIVTCNVYFNTVPGAPSAVKALLMKSDSILVSWKAPEFPNGLVNQYTVYMQEGSV